MNILRRELRASWRTLLAWSLIIGLMSVMMMALFPAMMGTTQDLEEFIKLFPPEMVKAFGMDRMSFGEPMGFFGTEVYIIVILTGSIFAALLGSGILAKEEDDKTVEFLLAKPVSRSSVLGQKILAFVLVLLAFNLVVAMSNFLGFALFVKEPYSAATLALLSAAPFFAHLTFASLGFLSALFWTRRRAAYSVSIGVAIGTWAIGLISLISDKLAALRWISPYRYVEAADIYTSGRLEPLNIGLLLLICGAALALALALYRRRDITV